jgi:hypothetical protein
MPFGCLEKSARCSFRWLFRYKKFYQYFIIIIIIRHFERALEKNQWKKHLKIFPSVQFYDLFAYFLCQYVMFTNILKNFCLFQKWKFNPTKKTF